tara:strand:+ start:398 stop:910 length:513 start_codon:yes stop_codon:yes gene_type:complete
MIVWLIGMSGSGKSTLAQKVIEDVKKIKKNILLIDGDDFREAFGNDLSYTLSDRKINAERIANFCKFCDRQGIHVVCAVLAIFPDILENNRNTFKNYYEVFIDAPIEHLKKRDVKGIYAKAMSKKIVNVVGVDIEFPIPKNPNLHIKNNHDIDYLLNHSELIVNKIISDE